VREALKALPCVEPSSVRVDFPKKEAHFSAKKDAQCDIEEARRAITGLGYRVSGIKSPAAK
jgi:copper chaperone CopZ